MNYSQAEYLVAFISILFGLVGAEFFNGWGKLLKNRFRVQISLLHLAWTFFTFTILVIIWWTSWTRIHLIDDNIATFYLLVSYPVAYHLAMVILFPEMTKQPNFDIQGHFRSNQKAFFIVLSITFVVRFVYTISFESSSLVSQNAFFTLGGAVLSIAGAYILNLRFHQALVSVALVMLGFYILSPGGRPIDPPDIDFSRIEYLTNFTSILYGYVAAEYFIGWGTFLRRRKEIKLYMPLFLWSIFSFSILIEIWWLSWFREKGIGNSLMGFYASLFTPLIFHFISVLLFQNPNRDHFNNDKKLFFRLFSVYLLSNIAFDKVLEGLDLFHVDNIYRMVAAGIGFVAAEINNRTFHNVLPWIAVIALIVHHIQLY